MSISKQSNESQFSCAPCAPSNKKLKFQKQQNNLEGKQRNLQKTLTLLAFKPCCKQKCLKSHFGKLDDCNYFNYDEARQCFNFFFSMYQFKNKIEYDMWIYDKFLSTCFGLDEQGKIIHQFKLTYGNVQHSTSFNVCREAWAYFMNATDHKMRTLSDVYHSNYSAIGSSINSRTLFSDATNHHTNIDEMKQIYTELGLEVPSMEMLQMGAVQRHEMETFIWFRDHFDLVGDPMPNTPGLVHIDKIEKQEIYCMYVNEVRRDCLTFSSWNKFWKRVFPNVKIRQWKNVTGKCEACAQINNGRLLAHSQEESKAFRRLHLLHKAGNFMLERLSYHERRREARNDPSILSLIIDTMDNNHCSVPYLGVNDSMSDPIHQGILGAFAHNSSDFTIYRTTGTWYPLAKYRFSLLLI